MSEHPLGKAIVRCYGSKTGVADEFMMITSEGVTATVDGKHIKAGNLKLISVDENAQLTYANVKYTQTVCPRIN